MPEAIQKPLSEKPIGYILAVVAGTLGGPIGWITSPLVLFGLTKAMRMKDDKTPNRFLVWALIGAIGVPLSVAPLIALSDKGKKIPTQAPIAETVPSRQPETAAQTPAQPAQAPAQPAQGSGVNMNNYNRIQTGMSYDEVVQILGEQGSEMSSNDIGGYKNIMYMWKAGGFSGGNMNAMFQNGALIQKAQFGLE